MPKIMMGVVVVRWRLIMNFWLRWSCSFQSNFSSCGDVFAHTKESLAELKVPQRKEKKGFVDPAMCAAYIGLGLWSIGVLLDPPEIELMAVKICSKLDRQCNCWRWVCLAACSDLDETGMLKRLSGSADPTRLQSKSQTPTAWPLLEP